MPLHELASVGFTRAAAVYEQARPGYPPEAIGLLRDEVGVGPGTRLVDLAAGTGKFTRLLVVTGATVLAVEPLAAMRHELRGAVPGVPIAAGTAEALPLAGHSVDVVTVAQAFHWFDVPRALDELYRVLRPGGALALTWNARPRSGWPAELDALADAMRGSPELPGQNWPRVVAADRRFTPVRERVFDVLRTMTPAELVTQMASHSHIASMDDEPRAEALAAIQRFLDEHPETRGRETLEVVRPCEVYWCRTLPASL